MNQQLSFDKVAIYTISLYKLKSCSVWCFSGKKDSGDSLGMGAFGPSPVGGPAPTYSPYKNKNGKYHPFLAFYILPPPTLSPTPPPSPPKKNLVQLLEKGLCTLENSWDLAMDFDWR